MRRSGPRRIFRFPLRGQVEQDVDAELRFHLEMRTEDLIEEEGLPPAAAREEALRRFGDLGRITDTCHEIGKRREKAMWWSELATELRQDCVYALRQMGKTPLFTVIAVLTLALGVGATTSIFSILDAVVLRPLPFSEPERLTRLFETNPRTDNFSVSEPNYREWREANRSFTDMAAISYQSLAMVGQGEPVKLHGAGVTASFFSLLAVRPLLGRVFLPEEDRPGRGAQVAILSHGLWRSRFGGDPGVVGRSLRLDGRSFTVIGVMPADFVYPDWAEIWTPLVSGTNPDRDDRWLDAIARLKPGVSLEQARADLDGVAAGLAERYPESNRDWGVRIISLQESIVGPQVTRAIVALFGAVGLLLLMACVNVSNLLLARATVRGREMGLRSALGAGRARLLRQLLTESLLLAGLGALAGLGVAHGVVKLVRAFGPDVPRLEGVSLDGRVFAFTLLAALVTGVLFGLAPALQASRTDLHALLQQGGRAAMSAGRRLRDGLVVGELALAMVLLICAGLMIGSFLRLQSVDTGFDTEGVLMLRLDLPPEEYPEEQRRIFLTEVLERIAGLPGVREAGATNAPPFGAFQPNNTFAVEGREPQGTDDFLSADWRSVTPGFFRAMGIPLRRGRLLTEADREGAQDVIVISQTMADRVWPGEDPIGRRIFWGGVGGTPLTIVGVVGDVRDTDIEEVPQSVLFAPYQQVPWPQMTLMVKTTADGPPGLTAAIRREIRALDGDLPIPEVLPLRQSLAGAVAEPRFRTILFGAFAAAALVLAVIGVYGVMAFAVAQRTREIGVRLALGARPWSVVALVLRRGLLLTLVGIGLGWAGALALTRFLASLLYGTEPTDAVTYAAVALLLAGVATAAGYFPASRAAEVDPRLAFSAE